MSFKRLVIALLLSFACYAQAQQFVRLQPIQHRAIDEIPASFESLISWGISDTLTLPFFEDFAHIAGYPKSTRWVDNLVWINNSFPKKAPNFGVATFDHLNAFGNPYHTLDKREMVFADSLTSQPINLQFKRVGNQTINYKPTDSISLDFTLYFLLE